MEIMRIDLLKSSLFWMAQAPLQTGIDFSLSGSKFFVALIAGVLLALAFQLLLTNFSVAAGITYLGNQSDDSLSTRDSNDGNGGMSQIGLKVGLWTLITVSITAFFACYLAVKLSLPLLNAGTGAILALVIWAAYFCLLVWFSSATVGSMIGSIMNTLTTGFQAMVKTAATAMGGKMASDRILSTVDAAATAVRRELSTAVDPVNLRHTVEDYLETLRPAELDIKNIRSEFESLLKNPELQSLAAGEGFKDINRQTFVDLVNSRTDLSKREASRLVDQLETAWKQVIKQQKPALDPMSELRTYLTSALPEQLRSNDLSTKLEQLGNLLSNQKSSPSQPEQGILGQAMNLGVTTLIGTVLSRKDLSDLDVQKIGDQLRKFGGQVMGQTVGKLEPAEGQSSNPPSTIRSDIEYYLLNTYSWEMTSDTIAQDFRAVLYDQEADPGTIRQELNNLNRNYFTELLRQRGVFTQDKIAAVADRLDAVRQEVIAEVREAEINQQALDLSTRIERFLRQASRDTLTSEKLQYDVIELIENTDAEPDILREILHKLDGERCKQLLIKSENPLISSVPDADQVIMHLQQGRDRVLADLEAQQVSEQSQVKALQLRVESYLQNTHQEALNPEGIKRDLKTLVEDPEIGLIALRTRFSQFDRETLVKLLSQRQDLTEAQVNQAIDQVESTWNSAVHVPQAVASKAKQQYEQVTTQLADYLRNTNLEELNPEGIQRDLAKLLDDPKAGAYALQRRLSQVDRDTLVKLLSQRQDLSEGQVNQVIDDVQSAIRQTVKVPRRLAIRTKEKVVNFEANLESYLRNTQKEELNPDSIKRDLQLLLHDPRAGVENLGDRLAKVDRSTLVALLSQRKDMTEAEANRIVDQIESVRDQFRAQIRQVQQRLSSLVEGIFDRLRNYLNSLERPELNYDDIQRDMRQLFSDPQAGFDALRDRLGHFNRDTLVAILSSRDDISEFDANRILDQVESARNSALSRAERLQQVAQSRLEDLKRQAQKQAEETRKAAEVAAWWLFGTAVVSASVSAWAGALAVIN